MNLTPLAMGLIAGAVLLGILEQWTDWLGPVPWWRLVVGLLLLALVAELLITRRRGLHAALNTTAPLYLGRMEQLELAFENRTAQPMTVQFEPVFPAALLGERGARAMQIGPREVERALLAARPLRLGAHAWPPVPARIKGPLGLAWWSRRLVPRADIRVLPDTLGPRIVRTGTSDAGASARIVPGGAMELHHLRPYRAGDPRHTIDWKATARASRLITRVFSEDQHLEVIVLLDAGRTSRTEIDGMSQLGHYANLAARFAEYCVAGDDQVGLITFADVPLHTLGPARGAAAVTRIRAALGKLDARAVESDVVSAALHARRLVRHRCLVVVLTDLYERSATSQLVQTARLLAPKHLPIIVGLMSEEVLDLAGQPAGERLDAYRSLAAREYQRHVAANIARLRRLGAHAMTARPRELDAKVLGHYALLRAQRRI